MKLWTITKKKQLIEIQAWEGKKPSTPNKIIGVITKPIEWTVNNIIPNKAIEGALNSSNFLANLIADHHDIIRDGKVSNISELRRKDLKMSDNLANNVHNWAIGIAATEGAGTGAIGILWIADCVKGVNH
ncbi:MAG: EcsC family protein [Prevotella sp.]|nr:EcsC family protein [Prevotella sp.]